jgi:hypothetical protein
MAITAEERAWLEERQADLQRELDLLCSGKLRSGYSDKNDRRIELTDALDEVRRQLREGQEETEGTV